MVGFFWYSPNEMSLRFYFKTPDGFRLQTGVRYYIKDNFEILYYFIMLLYYNYNNNNNNYKKNTL